MKGIILSHPKSGWVAGLPVGATFQTRRLSGLKDIPAHWIPAPSENPGIFEFYDPLSTAGTEVAKPRYKVGEVVYCKEAWAEKWDWDKMESLGVVYPDTCPNLRACDDDGFQKWRKNGEEASPWQNPIFMPQWAARSFFKVLSVRVGRARDISEADAVAEGFHARILFICPECRGDGETTRMADDMDIIEGTSCGGYVHRRCVNCAGFGVVEGSYADMEEWGNPVSESTAKEAFIRHFESLNGPGSAEKWCFVYEMEKVKP